MKSKLIVFLIGFFLTIVMTWPFAQNISSYYSDQGDYALAGSVLWWNQDSIKTGLIFNQKEYFRGFQFYPQPMSLAFANNSLAPEIFFAPIYWLTNNLPFSVNSYAFLTCVLSFLSSYYAINYFTKNKLASLVGAFIYTFNPQTLGRFPQHLDILGKYYLPLVFLFAYKFLEKPSLKNSLGFFITFTLNALTVNYYQIFSVVMLPILALPFILPKLLKKNWAYFLSVLKFGLVGVFFIPILLYFNLPYLDFSQKEGAIRPLEGTPFFSARINDWLLANPDNFIYGGIVKNLDNIREPKDDRGILNYEEHTLFLGVIPVILFILGLKIFRKQKINKTFYFLLLILPFLYTFGPYFNGADEGFPLPFYWLYKITPLMEGIRSPSRFEFLFYISFSLICAFGVSWLTLRFKKFALLLVVVLLFGLIIENFTVKNFDSSSKSITDVQSIGLDKLTFLKNVPTLHLPIYSVADADNFGKNSAYINWATQTGEKIFNGNTAYLPPDQLYLLESISQNLDMNMLSMLKALGIKYIVIHKQVGQNLPKEGIVLETSGIAIVELAKIAADISICKDSDLSVRLSEDILIAENKGNCIFISPFDLRYREMTMNVLGVPKKVKFRMPLVLNPNQQVVDTISDRTLRIE